MIALAPEGLETAQRALQCFREFTHAANHFVGFSRRGNVISARFRIDWSGDDEVKPTQRFQRRRCGLAALVLRQCNAVPGHRLAVSEFVSHLNVFCLLQFAQLGTEIAVRFA